MICKRNHLKNIFLLKIIVLFHIVKESLFVADEIVKLKMVVNSFIRDILASWPEEIFLEALQSVGKLQHFLKVVYFFKKFIIVVLIRVSKELFVVGRKRGFENASLGRCLRWLRLYFLLL